jgi:micrococcal nuclease
MKKTICVVILLVIALLAVSVYAHYPIYQPSDSAEPPTLAVVMVKVYDGDTVKVELNLLPPPLNKISIRLRGIDTPEKGHRAACDQEREMALNAKLFVETVLLGKKTLLITNYGYGKWAGRIVGDIMVEGTTLSKLLIDNGHAVAYDGGTKSKDWCAEQ